MSPAKSRVSSASVTCLAANCPSSSLPNSVVPSRPRCLAISFETRAINSRTSSFVLARLLSASPDSRNAKSSFIRSMASAWPLPALRSWFFSNNDTIVLRRSPTSASRAWANTLRKSVARRGSLPASRSANRRNDRSRSRNCSSSCCSRATSEGRSPPPSAATITCPSSAPATVPTTQRMSRNAAAIIVPPVPPGLVSSVVRACLHESLPAPESHLVVARSPR